MAAVGRQCTSRRREQWFVSWTPMHSVSILADSKIGPLSLDSINKSIEHRPPTQCKRCVDANVVMSRSRRLPYFSQVFFIRIYPDAFMCFTCMDWPSVQTPSHTLLATNRDPSNRSPAACRPSPSVHDDPGWELEEVGPCFHFAPGPSVVNHSLHPAAKGWHCSVAENPVGEDSRLGQIEGEDIHH